MSHSLQFNPLQCCRPDFHDIGISILDSMRMRQPGSARPLVISEWNRLTSTSANLRLNSLKRKLGWNLETAVTDTPSGMRDPCRASFCPNMPSIHSATDQEENETEMIVLRSSSSLRVSLDLAYLLHGPFIRRKGVQPSYPIEGEVYLHT
jgi:hypothetical protein